MALRFVRLDNFRRAPVRVTISGDGTRALVPHRGSNEVHLIDLKSHAVLARAKTGKGPGGALFLPGGKQALVANTGEGTVSILDLDPFRVTSTHPAGKGPDGLHLLGGGVTPCLA